MISTKTVGHCWFCRGYGRERSGVNVVDLLSRLAGKQWEDFWFCCEEVRKRHESFLLGVLMPEPEAQAAHPASRADHRTQPDRSRTDKECQEMLGPETSQTRKAASGTRTHGLPHAERMLYQLSQIDPDHAVKGPHRHTQKPPKTKALAKKRRHLKRRPTQVAPLEPRRCQSRAESDRRGAGPTRHEPPYVLSFLRSAAKLRPPRIQAAKLSAVQQYHSYQGIQL